MFLYSACILLSVSIKYLVSVYSSLHSYNIIYYNMAFVNSERWLAKSRVDITLCQHGKFSATLLLKFFVLYYKRNIKHFFRVDIQLYQHSWKLEKLEIVWKHSVVLCSGFFTSGSGSGKKNSGSGKKTPAPAENMWKLKFNRILTFQSGHTIFVSWYFTHAHFVQCMIDGIYSFPGGEQTPAPAK